MPESGDDVYKYLSAAGVSEGNLRRCCVKEAEVIGVDSTETVRLLLDEVEYSDVPVWIHTDVGSRTALILEEEAVPPETYFKNSALVFPFPGLVETNIVYPEKTFTPTVHVVVYTDPESGDQQCVAVIRVLSTAYDSVEDNKTLYPTYRMFIGLDLDYSIGTGAHYLIETYLYDLIEDKAATMPSLVDGEIALPFIPCEIKTYSDEGFEDGEEDKALALVAFLTDAVIIDEEPLGTGDYIWFGAEPFSYTSQPDPIDIYTDGPFKPVFVETMDPGGDFTDSANWYEINYYGYIGHREGDYSYSSSASFEVISALSELASYVSFEVPLNQGILPISGYMGFGDSWGIYVETALDVTTGGNASENTQNETTTQTATMTYGPGISTTPLVFSLSGDVRVSWTGVYPNQESTTVLKSEHGSHKIIHSKSTDVNFFCDLKWIDLLTVVTRVNETIIYSLANGETRDSTKTISLLNNTASEYIDPLSMIKESGFSEYFHGVLADVLEDKLMPLIDLGYEVDDVLPDAEVTIYFIPYDINEGLL